ncbi:deoxyuridine 5'-triphosphate nucleotidohydrolase [Spirochaetia bacterium]|nr:deoxyuridine 5'-triphosphate nucleotidohydrolase [Spirochaetia bacterium]
MYFTKVTTEATLPTRGSSKSAGMDIYSAQDIEIKAGQTAKVHTDLKVNLPENHYGQLLSRSGLALKMIVVEGGVIDEDYEGELKVLLRNQKQPYNYLSKLFFNIISNFGITYNYDTSYYVKKGDRIAQLVCIPYHVPKDDNTIERGENGFGSTGN